MVFRSHNPAYEAVLTDVESMHSQYPIHTFEKSVYGVLDAMTDNYLIKPSSELPTVFDETVTPQTQVGSYIHDLLATRKLTFQPDSVDLRASEYCDMAEPTMLMALETSDVPRSRPLIFVHDSTDTPIAVIKNRGDATAFALHDHPQFKLGESGIYSMTFSPRDVVKTSQPHIRRLNFSNVQTVSPGRISVFSGSEHDREKYRPDKLHKWSDMKRKKIPVAILKRLATISHDEFAANAHEISESVR